ncbi:MAG: hypothetical protein E6H73_17940 [Betaproteobacteria bacterium]|nr:MAG: hypothetical protein E6H73_17940 [Betaproteobacteria bacterium]
MAARQDARAAAGAQQQKGSANQITYDREAAMLDAAINDAVRFIDKQPDNTLVALETVTLYTERARLTGNYDDYRNAQVLLDAATARGNKVSFPCLAHAKLHYALHRLQAASAALDACPVMADPVEIAGLRGDIAFYSARYQEAEELYRALVNRVGTTPQYFRLAILRNKMGSPGEAAALLEAAEKRYHGGSATMKAWFKVQRGLIAWDRGQLDEALALYSLASDELPGWWLIDEQLAEVKRLKGDTAAAKALYEGVIRRYGLPEHMDELARLLREGTNRVDQARRDHLSRAPQGVSRSERRARSRSFHPVRDTRRGARARAPKRRAATVRRRADCIGRRALSRGPGGCSGRVHRPRGSKRMEHGAAARDCRPDQCRPR